LKTNHSILLKVLGTKIAVILLIAGSTVAAFATLGDGKIKGDKNKPLRSLLSNKTQANSFSLHSGYSFRGTQVMSPSAPRYINLNTVVTYQRGHSTYILPLKKKVLLPNVKIDISNRQLRRN
jgi:hypothetical protein